MKGKSAELSIKLTATEGGETVDATVLLNGKAGDLIEGWCRLGQQLAGETGAPISLLCALAAAMGDEAGTKTEIIDMSALTTMANGDKKPPPER